MDEDYNVTVIAPENPRPGTFAQPRVVVEYSNGSKDELSLLVVVDPNHTQVTDLVRPDLSKGKVNDPITAQITTTSILDGYDPVAPKTFEVDQSTVPAGWTVTVDNTGKVTAKADDTVAPGTIITPKVTATYPDGTTDDVETQFQAIVDIKIPTYDTVTNKPGTEVSLTPTVPERGLSGNTTDEAPKRYTFEDGETEYTHTDDSGTWTVKIDENTGEITTTIPQTAPEGYILNVPVLTHYDNADKPQQVKGSVVVLKGDIAPVYSVESTGPNKAVDHQVQDAPKGSTFSFGKNPNGTPITEMTTEDGWKYTIDPDTGVVTSTPPADAKPGDKKTITVDVVTPNGSTSKVPVTTVVKLTNSWEAEPSYPAETVYPGETATSPLTIQKPEGVEVAKENPYVIQPAEGYTATGENNEFGNPTYTVTTENGEWIVGLDDKGNVVATAPKTAKPGDKINVPVKVTYSDGSTDDVTAPIAVKDNPKRPVPFGVEYVYDDTIPAGEYRTVTKGVAGEEKQKRDGTWEQTTAPTNEVVHVGTKQAEASEDVTWTVPIPYSTTTRPNPALAPGETKVVQQGVNGERTYTAKFTAAGDQASVVESEVKKEPVEEIIEYGPRLADQQLVTQTTRPIPFDTTIVYDDTLEAGKQVVDKEGVVGEEKVTSTQKLVDGKPSGEPVVTTDTTKPKQDAVIRVGTKTTPTIGEQLVDIPFTTKIVYDPTLQPGDRVVDVAGQNGQVKVTVTNGVPTVKTVKEPVQEVVRVGTKPADGVEWTEETPYAVKVEEDPNLEAGKYVVAQEGVPGKTVHHADGTETKTPAKDHIIKVGTKNADSVKSTFKAPIPAPVRIVYDDSLPAGTYQEDPNNPGVDGEKEVTVTRKMVNGQPTGEPVVEEKVLTEAKPKVIKVGTKQPEAGENVTWTEPIPFTTEFRENPALKPGETKVVQEGKDGEATYKIGFKANGESATVENTNQRVEPVNRIIEYGPGPDDDQISSQVTRPIEFKTSVIYDETLEEGKQVITQGELGEEVVTTTQKIVDGKPSGNPVVTTEQTKAPKNAVIRIGTKKPGAPEPEPEITQDVELPFTTKIVYDPTLKPGERVVDTPGQPGKVKVTVINGRAEVSTVKEPVQEVVRVGTKPADDVEYTYETPYKVKVETDPTLPAGEVKVVQPGKVGLVKVVGTTETVVNEPVDQIIKIGTQTPLGYPATETPVEKQVKVKANTSKPGLTYRLGEVPEGWTATINESTGELTVTPGPTVKDGDTVDIPVIATDADTGAEYGTYAKVKATAKPSVPGGNDSSSEKANQIAKQCFGNALQSPIAWLLPVALLSVVVGKLIEPYMGQINAQFDAINRQIQQNLPKHGHGGHGGNDQLNEQIAYINGQFQAFASNPTVQMVGKVIGGALALGALIGLLYDWCSAEVGQAKTSIDFSKRGGKNVFQDGEGSSTKGGNQQGGSSN
nr:G5 domain-containing protein [Corynebacterium aquatimens]